MENVETPQTKVNHIAKCVFVCTIYVFLSGSLIRFNKMIVDKHRFHYPMTLTALHMFGSTVFSGALYVTKPSMFPAMASTAGKRMELLKYLVPIGICFAGMLYCSNLAYQYCNVSLLQFMKEANVILVFLLSYMAGFQTISRERVFIILWILCGSTIAVDNDLNFSAKGVAIQASGQIAECIRIVLAEFLLRGSNKFDPLTYTLFVAPLSFCVLIVGNIFTWDPNIIPDMIKFSHLLIPNVILAFALNVCIALVIKEVSAVGFMLTGLVKDVCIVLASALQFHEQVVPLQWVSFLVVLIGVGYWSLMKTYPDGKAMKALSMMLCNGNAATQEEAKPLVPGKLV